MATSNLSRSTSFIIVIVAYIVCFAAGYGTLFVADQYMSPVWSMLVADIVATLVIWCFSIIVGNASMYDAYWSVIPIGVVYLWAYRYSGWNTGTVLVMIAFTYWGLRLTYNWARGWQGLSHQDWRYKMLEDKNPKTYWLTNLAGIHLFPTVVVFLCMLPAYFIVRSGADSVWVLVGFLVSVIGTSIELIADEQMRRFRSKAAKSDYIDVGLWKYSRHPNYFGEISFWMGVFIAGLGAGYSYWWLGAGVVILICMFVFASIPMMEERTLKTRPAYAAQIKRVSALIPWLRRR